MRILITGAAGFIGSNLCRYLLKSKDIRIAGIDNLNSYYSKKIKKHRIRELSGNNRFEFFSASVLDKKAVRSIVKKIQPDYAVHAAAEVGVRNGEENSFSYYTTNVLGTASFLEELPGTLSHIVVLSSSSVYGNNPGIPYREDSHITYTTPVSAYGTSKAAMEMIVANSYRRTHIPTTIVRPFSVYGPDGRPDMLPMKLLLAARLGKRIDVYAPKINYRDWTYIDDVINYLVTIMKSPGTFDVVNIGSGRPLRLDKTLAIAAKVIKKYGYTLNLIEKPGNIAEVRKTHASTVKLETNYGRKIKTQFEEGFKKTAAFFFSHEDVYLNE